MKEKNPLKSSLLTKHMYSFLICTLGKHYRAYTCISNKWLKVFQIICKWILNFASLSKQMTEH